MPPSNPLIVPEPQSVVLVDSGAPRVTPWKIGQLYVDRDTSSLYQAQGGLENTSWVVIYAGTPAPT